MGVGFCWAAFGVFFLVSLLFFSYWRLVFFFWSIIPFFFSLIRLLFKTKNKTKFQKEIPKKEITKRKYKKKYKKKKKPPQKKKQIKKLLGFVWSKPLSGMEALTLPATRSNFRHVIQPSGELLGNGAWPSHECTISKHTRASLNSIFMGWPWSPC